MGSEHLVEEHIASYRLYLIDHPPKKRVVLLAEFFHFFGVIDFYSVDEIVVGEFFRLRGGFRAKEENPGVLDSLRHEPVDHGLLHDDPVHELSVSRASPLQTEGLDIRKV